MNVTGSVALVTGANGGIGQAFVTELLRRGAAKVYIAARNRTSLEGLLKEGGDRLVALTLDVTNAGDVVAAVKAAPDVTLLINNAGFAAYEGAISAADMDGARREMEVNYFGLLALTRAFKPQLAAAGGGAVLNVLSFLSLVSLPAAGTYAASKAASLSLTRSIRAELAAQHTLVVASMPVQVETSMGQPLPPPRLTPQEVVSDSLDAIQNAEDEVFPGTLSRGASQAFNADPKGLQAQLSTMLPKAA